MKETAFYLGLGALLTHELDAMSNHEWRLLPGLGGLPDDTAMTVFVALHVPLFALLIGLVASTRPGVRRVSRLVVAGFLVVHAGLHLWFTGRPEYEFSSLLSETLIFGGALCGALYLVLATRDRPETISGHARGRRT